MEFTDLPDEIIRYIGKLSITGSICFYLLKIGGYVKCPYVGLLQTGILKCGFPCGFVEWMINRWHVSQYSYKRDVSLCHYFITHDVSSHLTSFLPYSSNLNKVMIHACIHNKYIDHVFSFYKSQPIQFSLLFKAIGENGSLELLDKAVKLFKLKDHEMRRSWLFGLAKGGHLDTLITHHKTLKCQMTSGHVLNQACQNGRDNIVEWVLNQKPAILTRTYSILQSFYMTISYGHVSTARLMLGYMNTLSIPYDMRKILKKSTYGSLEMFKFVMGIDSSLNQTEKLQIVIDNIRHSATTRYDIVRYILAEAKKDKIALDYRKCFILASSHDDIKTVGMLCPIVNGDHDTFQSASKASLQNCFGKVAQLLFRSGFRCRGSLTDIVSGKLNFIYYPTLVKAVSFGFCVGDIQTLLSNTHSSNQKILCKALKTLGISLTRQS